MKWTIRTEWAAQIYDEGFQEGLQEFLEEAFPEGCEEILTEISRTVQRKTLHRMRVKLLEGLGHHLTPEQLAQFEESSDLVPFSDWVRAAEQSSS